MPAVPVPVPVCVDEYSPRCQGTHLNLMVATVSQWESCRGSVYRIRTSGLDLGIGEHVLARLSTRRTDLCCCRAGTRTRVVPCTYVFCTVCWASTVTRPRGMSTSPISAVGTDLGVHRHRPSFDDALQAATSDRGRCRDGAHSACMSSSRAAGCGRVCSVLCEDRT